MDADLTAPLHRMNPLERFSDRAQDYAKYRPTYPDAAIEAILQACGAADSLVAADVGAGTGISSRLLAERGVQVWAIEPNAEMRQAAEPHPNITFLAGNAEQTGLADAAVNLVTCFQAFHWFDPGQCLLEFRRILQPSGQLAVVWNTRDRADEFTAGYSQVVQQVSNQHPAEQRMVTEQPLRDTPHFHNLRELTFSNRQALDFPSLMGRAQSVSYIPRTESAQQQLQAGLQALYEQWADDRGLVYLQYCTQVFLTAPQ